MWAELSAEQRQQYIKGFYIDKDRAIPERLAQRFGVQPATIKRYMRADRRTLLNGANGGSREPIEKWTRPYIQRLQHGGITLSDITEPDASTDQGDWLRRLHAMAKQTDDVQVMHFCDVHFPYQDDRALDIAYQMLDDVQPHVVVVGSDAFDFPGISAFDRQYGMREFDQLKILKPLWKEHIDTITAIAPNSIIVYILGNHEDRYFRYLANHPEFADTLLDVFIDTIRQDGKVLYLGWQQWVRIGPLIVMHGNAATKYAANKMMENEAWQLSLMAGHVHRLTSAGKAGEDFIVQGVTSGCLCVKRPHYAGSRRVTPYQQGTAVAHTSLSRRDTSIENVLFYEFGNELYARFRGKVYSGKYRYSSTA